MIRKLTVETTQGTLLEGVIFKAQRAETVVIIITGVEGNIQNNPFYSIIGKKLSNVGVDFIVAHTKDAFNQTKSFNRSTGKIEFYGAGTESFADSDDDVQAYLNWAVERKYKHIILGGQSLGANKVIHYLAMNPNELIDKFLLLSPVNVDVLRRSITKEQRSYILQAENNQRGKSKLPFKLFRWLAADADTANEWLFDDTLNNVHFNKGSDFSQVKKIDINGALVIGTRDRFSGGNPLNYLQNINDHWKNNRENELVLIKDAGHIYRSKEYVLADKLLELLKKWHY
jgi:hypothetical protein